MDDILSAIERSTKRGERESKKELKDLHIIECILGCWVAVL
jgi:hypothetical protein